jgi:hypothetical protein
MIDLKIAGVMATLNSGTFLDSNLTNQLVDRSNNSLISNATLALTQYRDTITDPAMLTSVNSAISTLTSNATYDDLSTLSSHIGTIGPEIGYRMTTFDSVMFVSGDTDTANSVGDAFGSAFTARTFVSALSDIPALTASGADPTSILNRVNQISATPATVNSTITAEHTFFSSANSIIDQFSQAKEIVGFFSDSKFKAVLGAIANTSVLGILRS